jgi:DNA-binding PadR family transcriptional regulator
MITAKGRLPIYIEGLYIGRVTPPLQEPTFLVLVALAAEPLHGYGLIQAVAQLSEGRVALRAGTLYPALDRLTADRLVELAREEVVDGRLRRYYRLTDLGADRLRHETERLRRNAEVAAQRLATRERAVRTATDRPRPARRRPATA